MLSAPKGELADVMVSLKGVTGKSTGASAAPLVMDQKGCLYYPQILAVQTGQKIIVKNSDTCVHNVHTVPKENAPQNMVQMPGGADLTYTFRQAGNVPEIPVRRASVDVRVGQRV